MFTGFQLDTTSKQLPLGVRIVVTLNSQDEESFTFAITPQGISRNFKPEIAGPQPVASDVVTIEHTPSSLAHRFIIHLPEDQRIFIGDFPQRVAFEITIERQAITYWLPSNRVLVVVDGNQCDLFQAKEFSPGYPLPD